MKTKMIKIVGFISFILISIGMLLSATYLFRGHTYGYNDRISVVGLKEEKKDSIDVVYIGGSAAFVYWEPLKAYNDCGFTSYDLATNTIQAENILAYVKYAQQYQKPDLYVIGARAFQYYSENGNESGLRLTSDSLDVGMNKFSLIHEYLQNHKLDVDPLSLYLELTKYHTNYEALSNATAWHLIDNTEKCDYKGCLIQSKWCYLQEPQDFKTDQRADLLENDEKVLQKLLNYFDENDLNALFVVCPYSITKEQYAKYNTIKDIVTSHGYQFLNANDYYREMNLDFSVDFYNINHVNAIGAEKYTVFFEKYILENYELPDHRGDTDYVEWEELSKSFLANAEGIKQTVQNTIALADQAVNQGEDIRSTTDFYKWCEYVKDYHYSLLFVGNGESLVTDSSIDKKMLGNLGVDLSELFGTNNYIKLITDDMHNDADWTMPKIVDSTLTVPIGQVQNKTQAVIDNKNTNCSIKIVGEEYSRKDPEGVNLVVFDNYYRTVVDSVTLKKQDGSIVIVR